MDHLDYYFLYFPNNIKTFEKMIRKKKEEDGGGGGVKKRIQSILFAVHWMCDTR